MELIEYLKTVELGGDAQGFPQGKTKLKLSKSEIEEVEITDQKTGEKKPRWIIAYDSKKYWSGKKVVAQLKEAVEKGVDDVIVIRKGEGLDTSYMVDFEEK